MPSCTATSAASAATTSPPSTSSSGASPARTSVPLAIARALLAAARDSGVNLPGCSSNSGPSGASSKTSPPAQSSGSTRSCPTWNSAAMRSYRSRCRQRIAELHTSGVVSSWSADFLPTVSATSYRTSGNGVPGDGREEYAHKGKPSLETMARRGMLPTPTCREHKDRWGAAELARNSPTLGAMAAARRLPTPTAGDAKASGSRNTATSAAHAGTSLTDWARQDGATGRDGPPVRLCPRFVEWMMGLPTDYTVPIPRQLTLFDSTL